MGYIELFMRMIEDLEFGKNHGLGEIREFLVYFKIVITFGEIWGIV